MYTILRNKTISKTTALWKEIPFPQFNIASYKRQGIRISDCFQGEAEREESVHLGC